MIFRSALLMTILVAGTAHAGEVYKWTDEYGRVHYGSRPPATVDSKAVDTGVRKQEPLDRDLLIGSWYQRDDKAALDMTFRSDGTFIGDTEEQGWGKITFSGSWRLDGNVLLWRFTDSVPRIPGDFYQERRMPIVKLTKTELIDNVGGRLLRTK